ncbi:MAG TPA: TetR/AcrR family transcriptional regulator [Oscillospiraceae bacterium]|nr:TetR/AcrR family transcriptional regulator [Oscillospiraceae bacterium]HRW56267.1 TetR/AcrR family transcriptional regulator [Oscillospiraceae bacterium]
MPQFTKKAIIDSFVKLLNQKPLNQITVKDIVEDCGVSRKTFYYYYQDTCALVEDLFLANTERILAGEVDGSSLETLLLDLARQLYENRKLVLHVYNSPERDHLEEYIFKGAEKAAMEFVRKQAEGIPCGDDQIRILADWYMAAFAGLASEWIRRGMKDPPDQYIHDLGHLLRGTSRFALQNVADGDK